MVVSDAIGFAETGAQVGFGPFVDLYFVGEAVIVGAGEIVGCFVDFCFVGLKLTVGRGDTVGGLVGFGVLSTLPPSSEL